MKTKILFIAMFLFAGFTSFAQKAPKKEKDKVLVNKVYTVYFNQTGTKKPGKAVEDEMGFKGGKLNSKYITTELHFAAPEYAVSVDSSSSPVEITFSCESKNTDGDQIKIDGTVTEDAIEGTAVITNKKGKTSGEYAFSGNQKEKAVKGKKKE